jgi:hypothetical protein
MGRPTVRSSRTLRACIAALGLSVAACGEQDETRVAANYQDDRVVSRSQTVVTLTDGTHRYVLTGADLAPTELVVSYPMKESGTLDVLVQLTDTAGPIGTGRVAIALERDRIYGINVHIDSTNRTLVCFGCAGSAAFALRRDRARTVRDSLWVTWGFNSIRNPVIF